MLASAAVAALGLQSTSLLSSPTTALRNHAGALRPSRSSALRMDDDGDTLPGIFTDEPPPPSWGSPEWKWGSADGAAHDEAMRVREEFSKPHRRSILLTYSESGSADLVDLKMALALACQNARNGGYDEADGRWEALMEEMAAAKYEEEHMIKLPELAEACNSRLTEPLDGERVKETPTAAIAAALRQLDFVKKGL